MKKENSRRKIIIFICEGPTDENALYPVMKSFFNPALVRFHIIHGDFFLNKYEEEEDPISSVERILDSEIRRYGLKRSDVLAVFHATDTDGAFIPKECIFEDRKLHKIQYEKDGIHTNYVDSIIVRNRKKRKNLNMLSSIHSIHGEIPYRIYYFSHNLEAALYGMPQHLNDHRKSDLSDEFADRFDGNWRDFYNYVINECHPLGNNYQTSWDEIRKGVESVRRHTNINLVFEEFSYLES